MESYNQAKYEAMKPTLVMLARGGAEFLVREARRMFGDDVDVYLHRYAEGCERLQLPGRIDRELKKAFDVVDPDVVCMLKRQLPLWEKLEVLQTESGPDRFPIHEAFEHMYWTVGCLLNCVAMAMRYPRSSSEWEDIRPVEELLNRMPELRGTMLEENLRKLSYITSSRLLVDREYLSKFYLHMMNIEVWEPSQK